MNRSSEPTSDADAPPDEGGGVAPVDRKPPSRFPRLRPFARVVCVTYAVGVILYWLLLAFTADRWWVGTLLMYGPRWPVLLPGLVLLVPALAWRRLLLWVVPSLLVILGPVCGFEFPLGRTSPDPTHSTLRVLSLNCDNTDLDGRRLRDLVEETQPDVIVLQAYTSRSGGIVFQKGPWHLFRDGEFLVASRSPIVLQESLADPAFRANNGGATCVSLATPAGPLHVYNVHFATPRLALQALLRGDRSGIGELRRTARLRRDQFEALRRAVDVTEGATILAGDWNSTIESSSFSTDFGTGWTNAFSAAGTGYGFTHFTTHTQIRIDHVLLREGIRPVHAWIGPEVGSAHRPLICDVQIGVGIGPAGSMTE